MQRILLSLTIGMFLWGLCSCDVVSTFSVYNRSNERKLVEVVGIELDSIYLAHRFTKRDSARRAPRSKNPDKPSTSFYLEPEQTAWLEWGWGNGYRTRRVIINGKDTIQTIQTIWRSGKPPKNRYLARKRKFHQIFGGDFQVVLK
jgi:hypothetical protein